MTYSSRPSLGHSNGEGASAAASGAGLQREPKIAVVHDQLYTYGGAERVLDQILTCFPNADLFALFDMLPAEQREFIADRRVVTTNMQKLPFLRRLHRHYFMLMPYMIEQLDLSGYDIILSSSYLVAKGVLVGPDQLHICYVHSPMRYAWDLQHEYLREMGLERGLAGLITRVGLHYMRLWDTRTAASVDAYVANSHFISRRLHKVYHREAEVIYPPVDVSRFRPGPPLDQREDYFVTMARLVPGKCVRFMVEAFSRMPEHKLIVIGEGPELASIRAGAGQNVRVLGRQDGEAVERLLQQATAFVHAAEEDFGIAPIEAQACGTPVIAYCRGGLRETILGLDAKTPTGVFYHERSAAALQEAVQQLISLRHLISPPACCANAARFGVERFRAEIQSFVHDQFQRFSDRCREPARAAEAHLQNRAAEAARDSASTRHETLIKKAVPRPARSRHVSKVGI